MLKVGRFSLTESLRSLLIFIFFFGSVYIYLYILTSPLIPIGIVNPIEAKVRKGKGAVGAYGNERTQQSLQDFPVVDSEEEEEKVRFKQYQLFNCVAEYIYFFEPISVIITIR